MSEEIKQVIVMRKDLKMRRGKEIAQGAHASLGVVFARTHSPYFIDEEEASQSEYYRDKGETYQYITDMTPEMHEWKEGIFTKICVCVNSEEELRQVFNNAQEAGIPSILITDSGLTEFGGVPTITCAAIGPARKDVLEPITGHLKLY